MIATHRSTPVLDTRISQIAFLCVLVASPAIAAQESSAVINDPAYTHAQRLVEIEPGRRLNLYCLGEGSPTVVFDSGLTTETAAWALVQPIVAKHVRACSYDRAGVGFSDPGTRAGTSANIVDDLHRLLTVASVAPPYVLVGHSYGGMNVRLYKDVYPSEVVGMVLVDDTHEDWTPRAWKLDVRQRTPGQLLGEFQSQWALERECFKAASAGFVQGTLLYKQCVPAPDPHFSNAINETYLKQHVSPGYQQAQLNEDENVHFASADQVRAARRWYGDMPLIVLSAGIRSVSRKTSQQHQDAIRHLWVALYDELAALSSRGVVRVVPDSNHDIPMMRPDAITSAIAEVIDDASRPKQTIASPSSH